MGQNPISKEILNKALYCAKLFHRHVTWMVVGIVLWTTQACGPQKSVRENLNAQNEAASEAKFEDLGEAEGEYRGTLHLLKSDQDFDMVIKLKRVNDNSRLNQNTNSPSETVSLPKLSGSMTFPAIQNLDISEYASFAELLNPMGSLTAVFFDFRDFNPKTRVVTLPYSVSTYANQGNFGWLSGKISGSQLRGSWFSKSSGDVGEFEVYR